MLASEAGRSVGYKLESFVLESFSRSTPDNGVFTLSVSFGAIMGDAEHLAVLG